MIMSAYVDPLQFAGFSSMGGSHHYIYADHSSPDSFPQLDLYSTGQFLGSVSHLLLLCRSVQFS